MLYLASMFLVRRTQLLLLSTLTHTFAAPAAIQSRTAPMAVVFGHSQQQKAASSGVLSSGD
jgi:hypothetical protein